MKGHIKKPAKQEYPFVKRTTFASIKIDTP